MLGLLDRSKTLLGGLRPATPAALLGALSMLGVACGSDDVANGGLDSATDGPMTGAGADTSEADETDADPLATMGADTSDDDEGSSGAPATTGASSDTDTSTPDPTGPEGDTDSFLDEACQGIDCNDGVCEVDEDGAAYCSCDEGYASVGLSCVRCEPTAGDYEPRVPVAIATFELSLDGAAPPASHNEDGNLYLRALDSPDEVWLGRTHRTEVSQTIIPGLYEVFYEFESGGSLVPINQHARLGVFELDNLQPQKIDIPTATITVNVSLNGENAPDDPTDTGYIDLVNPATGDTARLGRTRDSGEPLSAIVIPGDYEIHYRVHQAGNSVPANTDVFLQDIHIPEGSGDPLNYDVDIRSVAVSGELTFSNDTPPDDPADYGRIELRGSNGDVIELGNTRSPNYSAQVAPGEYEVVYHSVRAGNAAPANESAVMGDKFVVRTQGNQTININIPTQRIGGSITVDDEEPPIVDENGRLFLRDTEGTDQVFLGDTSAGVYAVTVIPGVYDVFYSQDTAGAILPVNTNALLPTQLDTKNANTTIDVPVILAEGAFEIASNIPPTSAYDDGRIYLRAPDGGGDSVLLGNTRVGSYSTRIVPSSSYDVVYAAEFSEGDVPVNKSAIVENTDAFSAAGGGYTINVPMVVLSGSIFLNDAAPEPGDGLGNVLIESLDGEDAIFLAHTSVADFMRTVTSGQYLVRYRGVPTADGELSEDYPANTNAGVACIQVD